MMSACFFTLPSKLTAQFVTISFTMFAHLPFRPDFTSDSACQCMRSQRMSASRPRACAPREAHLAASIAGVDFHDIEAQCFANDFGSAGFADAGRTADEHCLFGRIFPLGRRGLAQVRADGVESSIAGLVHAETKDAPLPLVQPATQIGDELAVAHQLRNALRLVLLDPQLVQNRTCVRVPDNSVSSLPRRCASMAHQAAVATGLRRKRCLSQAAAAARGQ